MKKTLLTIAMVTALSTTFAHADTTINGFASIKAGMTTSSDESLYEYSDELDFKTGSLFALQIKSDLGEKLSVTGQLLGRGSDDFDVQFEWLYLSYQLSDNLTLNAGRIGVPFFKYSDFKDVGYAYAWNIAPQSVYSGVGFTNVEGISLYYTTALGDFDTSIQVLYGSSSNNDPIFDQPASTDQNNVVSVNVELSRDWYSFRAAYVQGDISVTSNAFSPLTAALFNTNVPGFQALASELDFDEDKGTFYGVGVTLEPGNWNIVFEYNDIGIENSFYSDRTNYYLSAGYRLDNIQPYVVFEREDHKSKDSIYQPYIDILPPQLLQPVIGIVAGQEFDATTVSAGLRYDFHPSAAFKVQYSSQNNKTTDNRIGLITVGVDLVF
ncbi:porin [Rheinheimera baltica]|uniref:Porin n=1 Tax=Rheinheimera baltica TaxID=67576 RepID=A0ABT9HXA7_9GAMM|nr:porin [Rheinheimera baltica]MDP5135754.1 porin [Rheinheimera baltica]MDP5142369.1 porin [Rheinheimera baltica]MDP5150729.1 porin [Rheinheimera baltica]MDP5191268.1 porin [Rheinheimera baltica]